MRPTLPYQRVAPGPRTVRASLHISAGTVNVSITGVFDAERAFVLRAALAGASTAGLDVVVDVAAARFVGVAAAIPLIEASIDLHSSSRRLELRGVTAWTAAALENAADAMTREGTS
jgi:hypothetical protein